MCGITGFFSYKNKCEAEKYHDAHEKIAHRGPDDEGFLFKNENNELEPLIGHDTIKEFRNRPLLLSKKYPSHLILGHRRLSIIDLTSQGHQPFNFEHLYLIYNGEIFNYIELRDELIEAGYFFETDTDTEVFLKAYHCWGVESFNRFNGMWAAAIYDKKQDNILLTRDRFGIKPLYYSLVNDNLIFGSEIKFINSFFDVSEVNEQMVYEYLMLNHINHTDETVFKDISQLEPSHYLIYSKTGVSILKYWDLKIDNDSVKVEDIEKKLNHSINIRMRSDVEVGSLLSGGIDSSLILAIIDQSKCVNYFQTFSAVFNEEKYSEKKYIDDFTVDNINLKKHFIYPDPDKLIESIEDLIYTQEEPFRSFSVFSQYEIYKYIKNDTNVTVLLNGQGADEIFTGYTSFYYVYLLELLKRFNFKLFLSEFLFFKKNRNLSTFRVLYDMAKNINALSFMKKDKFKVFNKNFKKTKNKKKFNDLLSDNLWSNLTFSALREYLRYEDKNSMRFSLESRLPFLDYELVQKAFSLSNEYKIKNGLSKYVLRCIAKNKIPDPTLNRKDKMGFVSPQEIWQKKVLKNEFDLVFERIRVDGIFDFIDSDKVYETYQDYCADKHSDWNFIWRVYILYKWKVRWEVKNNSKV